MAKVLITGAAGFIGSQVAHDFTLCGDDVTLIDNFSYGFEDNLIFDDLDLRKSVQRIDIRDVDALEKLFSKGFDFVYHNAAITPLPECQMKCSETASVNMTGTVNLLELSRRTGVKRFIFASTSAVYENETEFPCAEKLDVFPSLIYANTKAAGEKFCKSFSDCYGLPSTVLRYANVYGPRMDALRLQPPVVAYIIRELYYGRTPVLHSTGNQKRDFIYCDDLADLALAVRDGQQPFDIVNVSSNKAISINDIYASVAQAMGKQDVKPEYAEVSDFWSRYPGLYEGALPLLPEIAEHEVNKYTLCDNTHAKEAYDWIPKTDLDQGIANCVDYITKKLALREQGSLESERDDG